MSAAEVLYAARASYPQYLERAKTQTVTLPVYRSGALVAPSSGTYTLYDAENDSVKSAAVTIASSIATSSVASTDIPATATLGEGWREEWALVLSGETHTFRRPAALVLRALYPVITDLDITDEYTDLDDLNDASHFQLQIDAAWKKVLARLKKGGRFPYLIMDPDALREVHLHWTCEIIFRNWHTSMGDGKYLELAEHHAKQGAFAWKELNFQYDYDNDGHDGTPTHRRSATSVIYTSRPPAMWRT